MIINAAANAEQVGVEPRRAANVQLTAGLKKGGKIQAQSVHRFYLVHTDPAGGKSGSKPPHSQYPIFNEPINWDDTESVSLRTTFWGVLRHAAIEDNVDLSFYNFRGPRENPTGNRFKCRCDGKRAQRWNFRSKEYEYVDLPGGRTCPCFMSGVAKRTLRVWFQPVWQHGLEWPVTLTLWVTRARRTIDTFFGMVQDVEKFAASNKIDLSLVGLPFVLQWGRRKGEGTDYPDISVSFRGDIAQWAGWQQDTIHRLGGASTKLLTAGPGMQETEHGPDAIAGDVAAIIETRPSTVAIPPDIVDAEEVTGAGEPDPDDPMAKYPGAVMIEKFLGYMPRTKKDSDEAPRLFLQASCIKNDEKWFNLDAKAPREIWTAALDRMKRKT